MMAFVYLFLAALISFVCSNQPGPVNLALLHQSVHGRYKRALEIGIGGAIPETIYALIALIFAHQLEPYSKQLQAVSLWVAIAFIAIGIVMFLIQSKAKLEDSHQERNGLLDGFLISIVNPQLILFWLGIIAAMNLYHFNLVDEGLLSQTMFSVGAGLGAFLQHYLLVMLVKNYSGSKTVHFIKAYGNKIIGSMLILLGLLQLLIS